MDGAMDGEVRNERMLLKIAALLVSLSLVAERAAGRAFPVRLLVLSILWPAEAVARAFVARETPAEWDLLGDVAECAGGYPADAATLALRLRMLAAILCDLVGAALFFRRRQYRRRRPCAARRRALPHPASFIPRSATAAAARYVVTGA